MLEHFFQSSQAIEPRDLSRSLGVRRAEGAIAYQAQQLPGLGDLSFGTRLSTPLYTPLFQYRLRGRIKPK